MNNLDTDTIAGELARLYDAPFGSKERGRYRISRKHLQRLAKRRRLYPADIQAIERAAFERGFVLLDMESFFVLLSQKTFASYRRVNESAISC